MLLDLAKFFKRKRRKAHPGAPVRLETRLSRSLSDVIQAIAADSVERILILGDRAFHVAVTAALPGPQSTWASTQVDDILNGAVNPEAVDFSRFDAVIVGGPDAATGYRLAVMRMAQAAPDRPVHWVAKDWEFCAGTLAIASGIDDCEALVFNHFQRFFGIKDTLQFRIDILQGENRKHVYRILRANESIAVKVSEFFSPRLAPTVLRVEVTHPILTRDRHYRHRVCADLFWRDSFTTLHSAHEFNRPPAHKVEFRLPAALLREGEVAFTLPNYDRDMSDVELAFMAGGKIGRQARRGEAYLDESRLAMPEREMGPFFGWKYRGYGGSNWFAFEEKSACRNGHSGSLSGNHHASVPWLDRSDFAAIEAERDRWRALRQADYMIEPFALPIASADSPLHFGFEFDASNPHIADFVIHHFSAEGRLRGTREFAKTEPGPIFAEDLIAPSDADGGLAIVTPDLVKLGYRRAGLKLQGNLIVEHRRTGDRDVTEFQNSWRNCGLAIPGLPYFVSPNASAFGRTNLFGRARATPGYRSALLVVHASGWSRYARQACLTIEALDAKGAPIRAEIELGGFQWRLIWLDDILPGLADHLRPSGIGPLLVHSHEGDMNCQLVTVNDKGAVALQHMWGY